MTQKASKIRLLLCEPLVHFTMLGALIFYLYHVTNPDTQNDSTITISSQIETELNELFLRRMGRTPNDNEFRGMVDDWIQRELLYREGRALDIDASDSSIREMIISKSRAIILNSVSLNDPSDTDLRNWLEENQDVYKEPEKYFFSQYIISNVDADSNAASKSLFAKLSSEEEPRNITHRFMKYENRSITQLTSVFGADFSRALQSAPINRWTRLQIKKNWHIFKVHAVTDAAIPGFNKLRSRLKLDWRKAQRRQKYQEHMDKLKQMYRIVRESST